MDQPVCCYICLFQKFCHLDRDTFIISRIFEVKAYFKLFCKVYHKDSININKKTDTSGNFGCPKGVEKK